MIGVGGMGVVIGVGVVVGVGVMIGMGAAEVVIVVMGMGVAGVVIGMGVGRLATVLKVEGPVAGGLYWKGAGVMLVGAGL